MKDKETNNETVADIVRKVHSGDYGCAKCGDLCDCPNADKIIVSIADRIEAAHDRYIAAKDAEIAELRECLEEAIKKQCKHKECKNNVCLFVEFGKEDECVVYKWRKALEGSDNEVK